MHLIVNSDDVKTAHQITEELEARLQKRFYPARIMIHVEPPAYKSEHISYE